MTRAKKTTSPRSAVSTDVEIGERIRAARFLHGVRQQELALALGITFQQLQKYENGVNRVSATRLIEISRVLDVPIAMLLPAKANADDLAKVIAIYNQLDPKAQKRALEYLQSLRKG